MVNEVRLLGRFTRDNILKYTQNKTAMLYNTVAVDKGYGDKKRSYFIPVKMMGKLAENIEKLTEKGTLVYLAGELEMYKKDDKDVMIVMANEVKKIPGQAKKAGGDFHPAEDEEDLPF